VSISPLIDPGHDRGRRPRGRRGFTRPRAALAVALALAVAAIAALAVALVRTGGGHHASPAAAGRARASGSSGPRSRALSSSAAAASAPTLSTPALALSPIGLALGRAPLTLRGIGAPQRDRLQIRFHAPPRAGLLFNLDSGLVLWQRNPLRRLRVASLNKMMTALITVRSAPPGARVLVTREAVESQGSKVGVLPRGRHVRLESMLYGLLLPSGNDAATALAQRVAGSASAFVARMNREAAHLGLACTRFSSPSGYFDEGNFSCPADLAVLAARSGASLRPMQRAGPFHRALNVEADCIGLAAGDASRALLLRHHAGRARIERRAIRVARPRTCRLTFRHQYCDLGAALEGWIDQALG